MKKRIYCLMILLVVIALTQTACGGGQTVQTPPPVVPVSVKPDGIIAEGKLKPGQAANLSFQARGMVAEVTVKIGDQVNKGEVLARLANASEAEAQLASANLEMISAQQALNELLDTSSAELAQVVIDLKEAVEAYDKADDYLKYLLDSKKVPQTETRTFLVQTSRGYEYRTNTKHFKGPAPEDWIIEAENDLALKKANLEELQGTYARMKDGADKDQLALQQARLENARAQVAAAESNLSNYVLTAPFDGVIADVAAEIGEQVGAESRAVSIVNTSSWVVETTDITELEVVNVAVGQNVSFTADALSDVTMDGVVTEVSQSSFVENGDVIYTVRIAANDVDPRLKWGMTVEVTFEPLETN
ncbi:MAG TPA: HlyD family efflux transporter periplasmic adaptor subunit [Anaerolineales bacterium]|nr:HlyD family efflux transporter periplasmic adaptor subunit [Anaerolineales bacterium]